MPKNQFIYNQVSLLVGPSPSSGYHTMARDGALNNDPPNENNLSLIFPIQRVNNFSYNYSLPRFNIQQLGDAGAIKTPILNPTEVQINFNYYLMGMVNEMRLGLLANVPSGQNQGSTFLHGTGRVPVLSGLMDRRYDPSLSSSIGWPLTTREPRNFFAIVRKDQEDANDLTETAANKTNNYYTVCFGDCYLTSYSTSASYNALPQAQVGFVCNNITVYDGASGQYIPSINPTNQNKNSGIRFYIPNTFEGTGLPTILLPRDATVTIKKSAGQSDPTNLNFNFNDIKLQDYNISFSLDREPLYGVGHKYPLDRPINLPVFANVSFNAIVGDHFSGSLVDLIREDLDYDITIKLRYKRNNYFTGVAIQYDILKAKFNSFDSNLSIQSRGVASFSFLAEMKNDVNRGLFLSGYLGIPTTKYLPPTYLGDDFFGDGFSYLVTEDGDYFLIYDGANVLSY